mgnify:CR=1 FL=1
MSSITRLYEFSMSGVFYRYTNSLTPVTKDGFEYTPETIKNSNNEATDDANKATLMITVPRGNTYVSNTWFQQKKGSLTVFYRVGSGPWLVFWKGSVSGVVMKGELVEIVGDSLLSELDRNGLHAKYQVQCNRVLYDEGCRVKPDDYSTIGPVTLIEGLDITISGLSAKPNGYYTGGYVTFSGTEFRMIIGHTGDIITIFSPVVGLKLNTNGTVRPGCNHTLADCRDKFNNTINYLGCPWHPERNPFSSLGSNIIR